MWHYILPFTGILLSFSGYILGFGSNVCGYHEGTNICCQGWTKNEYGECSKPKCFGQCGSGGECIRPNTCMCANGNIAYSCDWKNSLNNDQAQSALAQSCPLDCSGRGTCDKGKCSCYSGYTGEGCQSEVGGPCFLKIDRGLCRNPMDQIKLTRSICCGAFNVAWGNPCARCSLSHCPKGYYLVDGKCEDINECSISPLICRRGKCINKKGSFECSCGSGYKYSEEKADCVYSPDYCQRNPGACGSGGECINKQDGSHKCKCSKGYEISSRKQTCVPRTAMAFNFCQFYKGLVCENGDCIPKRRTYECACKSGFESSSDRKSCRRKIDVCKLHYGYLCQNGECISTGSDYTCKCNPGYTHSYDQKKCISYCDLYPTSLCQNGQCIPKADSYECSCYSGYQTTSDGKDCRKVVENNRHISSGDLNDEAYQFNLCDYAIYKDQCKGGQCIGSSGSYRCQCLPGFTPIRNNQACQKSDQYPGDQYQHNQGLISSRNDQCAVYGSSLCPNGVCIASGSAYQCQCNSGYRATNGGKKCIDINECDEKTTICAQGTCMNNPGSYTCHCFAGFALHFVAGKPACYDKDECLESPTVCQNGRCVNTWGSYKCLCSDGYRSNADAKSCIPLVKSVQSSVSSSKDAAKDSDRCITCDFGCTTDKDDYLCQCPENLEHVGDTGMCADASDLLTYDIEVQHVTLRKRRSTAFGKSDDSTLSHANTATKGIKVTYRLRPTANVNKFLETLTPESKSLVHKKGCTIQLIESGEYAVHCQYDVNM